HNLRRTPGRDRRGIAGRERRDGALLDLAAQAPERDDARDRDAHHQEEPAPARASNLRRGARRHGRRLGTTAVGALRERREIARASEVRGPRPAAVAGLVERQRLEGYLYSVAPP